MKKIYVLFGTLFLFCSLFLSSGKALAQDTWVVYSADVLPNEATPALSWANVRDAAGVEPNPIVVVSTEQAIIPNPDMPGGNVLSFKIDGNPHRSWMWRNDFAEGTTAATVVVRAKGLPGFNRVMEMDLDFGTSRETVYINANNTFTFNVSRGDNQNRSLGEGFDVMQWHTYRFTKTATSVSMFVDESTTAIATAALSDTRTQRYFRFGDGASNETYGALYDWVAWDATGAYTPAQRALPDMGGTTAKKVAYVMSNKVMAENTADPIIAMLEADPQIDITVHALPANSTVDLAGYDVVVVQEGFGSGDNIYKPAGSLGLANITVPFLYNKTYALRNNLAVVTGGGTSADVGDTAIAVTEANRGNDLFKGITFTNGEFPVFKTRATDLGGSGASAIKTFNYTHGLTISAENTLLGTVPAFDAIEDKNKIAFLNDIPAGTTVGDQVTKARMIAVGLNTGAIMKDNGTNMTAEGLTLMRNAIYSLAGLTIPNTGVVTSLAAETRNAAFNLSQNYPNPFNGSTTIEFELKKSSYVTLEVYDITGKRVALLADGGKAAGVHEVKLDKNLKNGIYFYRLNADGATATRKMVVTQ